MVEKKSSQKRCFVICPIGDRGSEIRIRSDDLFTHLIQPVALEAGYVAERVIENDRPGDITAKIVGDIINSDAIVCDITGHNPNVFYELAIAHAWKKPCILLSSDDPIRVPFDISSQNVIQIRQNSFGEVQSTRLDLARHFVTLADSQSGADNPVSRFERGKALKESGDPVAVTLDEFRDELSDLKAKIKDFIEDADASPSGVHVGQSVRSVEPAHRQKGMFQIPLPRVAVPPPPPPSLKPEVHEVPAFLRGTKKK